jgi:hypothetical protein
MVSWTIAEVRETTMHVRPAILGALLVLLFSVSLPGASAHMQASDECAGADEYVAEVHQLGDELEQELDAFELSQDEIESWTASDFANAARIMEQVTSRFEELTPPPAAAQAHDDAIKVYGTFSQMFTSMKTGGLFGALPYTEVLEQSDSDLEGSALDFELVCEVAFLDHDDDDSPEMGLGSMATPIAERQEGSRQNPIPVGTAVDVGENWQVTVLNVEPDATERVLAESEYNDPPEEGRQFFIAEVSVTYTGEDSDTFSSSELSAVGSSSVAYSTYEDSCGEIPDELPSREVFSGGTITGNVCWSVGSEDVDSLVMYYRNADQDERVFLSLTPNP